MGKGKAPAAPDPVKTAAAQTAANKEAIMTSARVNQIGEVSPFGSLRYTGEVGSPDRQRIVEMNPTARATFDSQQALAKSLAERAGRMEGQIDNTPFSLDGLPPQVSSVQGDYGAARKAATDASWDQAWSRLEPIWKQREATQLQTLSDRGLPDSSAAYQSAMGNFNRARTDAEMSAMNNAILAGGSEHDRAFRQDMTNANLANQARQQALADVLLERTQPMNELSALLQGSPALATPQFGQAARYQMAPADVMGATNSAYAGQLNAYNTQQQQKSALLGALGSLGSAAMFGVPII